MTDVVDHAVARIDPATNKIFERIVLDHVGSLAVSAPIDPMGLALDGEALWVSDFDQGGPGGRHEDETVTTVVPNVDHPEGIALGFGSVWVVEHRKAAPLFYLRGNLTRHVSCHARR